MNCQEFARLLELHACGELSAADTAAFDAHARECAACASEIRRAAELDEGLRRSALAAPVDTAAFDSRVREQIAADVGREAPIIPPHPHAAPKRGWTVDAIGVAAAIALLIFAYRGFSSPKGVLAAAAQDHQREVIDGQARRWLRDPVQIVALAQQNGVPLQALGSLAPAGYHLDRAKRCPLDGVAFIHLVFSNGVQEFSVYLHPGSAVPLASLPSEGADSPGIHYADFGANHIDCFETPKLSAMVVSDGEGGSGPALSLAEGVRSHLR